MELGLLFVGLQAMKQPAVDAVSIGRPFIENFAFDLSLENLVGYWPGCSSELRAEA